MYLKLQDFLVGNRQLESGMNQVRHRPCQG